MKKDTPHILLINPWIDDFAAYDFWAKPLGLLSIAGILRMHGYGVVYVDCLDRFHGELTDPPGRGRFGKGHYLKRPLAKPEKLHDVPRNYSRYGIPEPLVRKAIQDCPKPAAVVVTCLMTYWYPGVFALIKIIREIMPDVPILLGGIYATLCHEHAVKHAGADEIIAGAGEVSLLDLIERIVGISTGRKFVHDDLDTYPYLLCIWIFEPPTPAQVA